LFPIQLFGTEQEKKSGKQTQTRKKINEGLLSWRGVQPTATVIDNKLGIRDLLDTTALVARRLAPDFMVVV